MWERESECGRVSVGERVWEREGVGERGCGRERVSVGDRE